MTFEVLSVNLYEFHRCKIFSLTNGIILVFGISIVVDHGKIHLHYNSSYILGDLMMELKLSSQVPRSSSTVRLKFNDCRAAMPAKTPGLVSEVIFTVKIEGSGGGKPELKVH